MQCSFDVYYVDENITYMVFFVICFFKQKTAYEMRISDWSSDVCSSDLRNRYAPEALDFGGIREISADHLASGRLPNPQNFFRTRASVRDYSSAPVPSAVIEEAVELALHSPSVCDRQASYVYRSEEHTSELQSLMRISYAVFCLKKKIPTKNKAKYQHN